MRLSHADFDLLQHTILELHDHTEVESFRKAFPGIFLKAIPAEYFGYADFVVESERGRTFDIWESHLRLTPDVVARLEQVAPEHPFTEHSIGAANPPALKLSDFYSTREFLGSALYSVAYKHAGMGRLLAIAASSSRGMGTLNFARGIGEKDFTERDRLMLTLLRPHFDQVWRNTAKWSARRETDARSLEDYGFSPREIEVAAWLREGKANSEIAIILGSTTRTVEKHVERILEKLGVENRTAAALTLTRRPDGRI